MNVELTAGIVRILNQSGATVGTGFVVSDEGLIATCAHVVQYAGSAPGSTVRIIFHATSQETTATVKSEGWRPSDAEDIAILRLEGPLPDAVPSLPLGSSADAKDGSFHTFGFPDVKPMEGMPGRCEVVGRTTDAGFPVLQLRSSEVSPGFSGAPVWDDELGVVVGMVVSIAPEDRYGRHVETAFIIPVETLRAACPALRLPEGEPYRGLQVFEAEHTELYFGRDAATLELLDALCRHDVVLLVGVSGSGKSSLVRAGLEKGLRAHPVPGLEKRVRRLLVSGNEPLLNLVLAVSQIEGLTSSATHIESILSDFDLPSDALAEANRAASAQALNSLPPSKLADSLRTSAPPQGLLLIVDQFERLYTECSDEDARDLFIETLLAAAGDRVTVLLALRADFYGLALAHPSLEQLVKKGGQVTVGQMSAADLYAAIEKPARALGRSLQPELAEQLIADVQGRAGDLPLLEFALTELWARDSQQGVLSLATYEALGYQAPDGLRFPGVQGAIAQRAEAIWQGLNKVEQKAARRIFLGLVTPGPLDERGEPTAEDTSRRAWWAEWDETTRHVMEKLVAARLLTTGQDPFSKQPTIEVAHEALIRAWPRLQRWVADHRPFLRWYNHDLAPFLRRWESKGRHPDLLLPVAMLAQAQQWLERYPGELSGPSAEYIRASVEKREQEREARERLRRWRTLAAAGAMVVLLFLALLAWGQRNAQARMALEAQSLALASSARQALADRNPDLAVALALAATKLENAPLRAQSALMAAAYASHTRKRFVGHDAWVYSVAYDPNGNTVLSGSLDGSVRLWDVETGQEMRRLEGHTAPVRSVKYSPDGSKALTGSEDGSLILWALESGNQIRQYQGHRDWVLSVALNPDGHQGLSGSADNTVILWDIDNGEVIDRLDSIHTDAVWSVAFSPTGNTAASASADGRVCLWSVQNLGDVWCFDAHDARVLAMAFSPRGDTLLTGSADNSLALWQVRDGELIHRFEGHTNWVYGVAFSPDGQTALSASADNSLILWDLKRRAMVRRLSGHTDEVQSVAFGPNGDLAVSGARDNSARLWDLSVGEETHTFMRYTDEVLAVAFSPDGQTILSGGGDHDPSLALWNVAERQVIQSFQGHGAAISSLAFSPDGSMALSGSHDGSLILWDVATGDQIHRFPGHDGAVRAVAISPDGRFALSGGNTSDHCLVQWNLDNKQEVGRLCKHTNVVTSIAFSPSGANALSGSHDHSLVLWDLESGQADRTFLGHNSWVLKVSFVQDGRTALSASADGTLILWDVETGLTIHHLGGHTDRVWCLAPSPDGRIAVSGSADGSLILWELESGTELRRFYRHDGWVWSVTFSPDARTVASGSADMSVRLWRLLPPTPNELSEWLHANRSVRDLTCDEKAFYHVEPLCGEQ